MHSRHGISRFARNTLHVGALATLTACASAAPSHDGPVVAREGASSGGMARIDVRAPTIESSRWGTANYPGENAVPAVESNPTRAASSLGGDEIAPGNSSNPTPVSLGQTISGQLARGDTPLADGSVADEYLVVIPPGGHLHVELHGGEVAGQPGSHMDMYLYLLHDEREVTHDDDGGGNLDSQIDTTVSEGGAYILRVTTFGSGLRAGAYTLVVRD